MIQLFLLFPSSRRRPLLVLYGYLIYISQCPNFMWSTNTFLSSLNSHNSIQALIFVTYNILQKRSTKIWILVSYLDNFWVPYYEFLKNIFFYLLTYIEKTKFDIQWQYFLNAETNYIFFKCVEFIVSFFLILQTLV